MALTSGTRLGPYEILAPIGAGGMGEVYKANDTRLDRTVAIKVLPEHLAESPERKARFEREAKAISQLNYPHICTLHDVGEQDGIDYIVMEYIEGETLAERLKKGALPLDKALEYGIQIADGLDTAHRAGIVHRDLKPANAMLTKSGIKLLDFGLAKLVEEDVGPETSDAPTRQKDLTKEESVIGTLQYMAPEQLERRAADARTDIFAFGVVLYEMVTGKKAFVGTSQASLITAIMSSEPSPLSELAPLLPAALDRLVKQCLTKDPEERMQSAHDIALQLQTIAAPDTSAQQTGRQGISVAWLTASVVATAAVTGLVVSNLERTQTLPELVPKRLTLDLPSIDRLIGVSLAVSPDGTGIVYAGSNAGVQQLFHRPWNALEAEPIQGTEGAFAPFFSPDGTWLAFFSDNQLKKVQVTGGPAVVVCDAPQAKSSHGSWGPDDTIVFATFGSALQQISSAGGVPKPFTTLDGDRGELAHLHPSFLPNGKAVLFTVRSTSPRFQVAVQDLGTGERRLLMRGTRARYVPTGHVVYAEEPGILLAVPFDADGLQLTGEPVPAVAGVQLETRGNSYDIGRDGTLVYVPTVRGSTTLVWVDRDGRQTPLTEERAMYRYPRLAPDATRVAVSIRSGGEFDVWVHDIGRGTRTRLTRGGNNVYPLWTPDGERVVFAADGDLFWAPADGSRDPELLLEQEGSERPFSWSPDGRILAYGKREQDIWLLPLGDEPVPFLASAAQEMSAAFSPDGRWVAYVSDESGRDEIYVQPYPNAERKWTISTSGGRAPLWSPQRPELYYRHENRVMVVPVETDPTFAAGTPRMLFEGHYSPPSGGGNPYYDVSSDGQRFLMLADPSEAKFHVVLNWHEELERLVPADN